MLNNNLLHHGTLFQQQASNNHGLPEDRILPTTILHSVPLHNSRKLSSSQSSNTDTQAKDQLCRRSSRASTRLMHNTSNDFKPWPCRLHAGIMHMVCEQISENYSVRMTI